jgi:hypothetical protein
MVKHHYARVSLLPCLLLSSPIASAIMGPMFVNAEKATAKPCSSTEVMANTADSTSHGRNTRDDHELGAVGAACISTVL